MSIIKQSADALRELRYKKNGLLVEQEPDERDYKAEDHLKLGAPTRKSFVDLFNTWTLDQKNTNHCTAFTAVMDQMIINIRKERDKNIFFRGQDQWNNQLQYPATADEKQGDYIKSALKALQKFGLYYNGKHYTIEKYVSVPTDKWRDVLAKGSPILTGARGKWPFTDKNHYWNAVDKQGGTWGHAWLICGYDDEKEHFICVNSWGSKWGDKGRFYVRYADAPKMFTGWVTQ